MMPVLSKAPCDVLAVSRSRDDTAVQAQLSAGCREMVSSLWDVIRVQDQVRVGCQHVSRLRDDRKRRIAVGCLVRSA